MPKTWSPAITLSSGLVRPASPNLSTHRHTIPVFASLLFNRPASPTSLPTVTLSSFLYRYYPISKQATQHPLGEFLSPRMGSGFGAASAGKAALRNYAAGLMKIKSLRKSKKKHGASVRHDFVCDFMASPSRFNMMDGCCPCITKCRASSQSYVSSSRKRYMDNDDYLALQGVPASRLVVPPCVTSSQFGGMIGNAMDVKLVALIFSRLLSVLNIPILEESRRSLVKKKPVAKKSSKSLVMKNQKSKGRGSGRDTQKERR